MSMAIALSEYSWYVGSARDKRGVQYYPIGQRCVLYTCIPFESLPMFLQRFYRGIKLLTFRIVWRAKGLTDSLGGMRTPKYLYVFIGSSWLTCVICDMDVWYISIIMPDGSGGCRSGGETRILVVYACAKYSFSSCALSRDGWNPSSRLANSGTQLRGTAVWIYFRK